MGLGIIIGIIIGAIIAVAAVAFFIFKYLVDHSGDIFSGD